MWTQDVPSINICSLFRKEHQVSLTTHAGGQSTVAAEGGLEPPTLHKWGAEPLQKYVCDVINISWAVLVLVNYRQEPDVL